MSNQNGFDSDEQEAYEYARYQERQAREQEPNVVPCFKCGGQMYQEQELAEDNLCVECSPNSTTKQKES